MPSKALHDTDLSVQCRFIIHLTKRTWRCVSILAARNGGFFSLIYTIPLSQVQKSPFWTRIMYQQWSYLQLLNWVIPRKKHIAKFPLEHTYDDLPLQWSKLLRLYLWAIVHIFIASLESSILFCHQKFKLDQNASKGGCYSLHSYCA